MSVPLGLWKPSLATINRSAGRMLRLAGGRHSPPQSQDRTDSWPICAVPNSHITCLHTHTAASTHTPAFFHNQACNQSTQLFKWRRWQFYFSAGGGFSSSPTEKLKGCFHPSVAVVTFWQIEAFFFPTVVSGKIILLEEHPNKCLWLQISSCQGVGNYSALRGSLSHP